MSAVVLNLTFAILGAMLGGAAVYVWASRQLAKRDPPHGLDDEERAERAMLAEEQRMDAGKAANRAKRQANASAAQRRIVAATKAPKKVRAR